MISINATLVVQVIQFLILVFILNRLMIQPILKMIDERALFIEKSKTEIDDIERETDRLRREFFSVQDDAKRNATEERNQLRSLGMNEADAFLEDSREKIALIRSEADGEAMKEIEKTQPLLRDEASVLADDIIERVIGRRIAG
jgi:F-type H+-transporting ATPase subunit b